MDWARVTALLFFLVWIRSSYAETAIQVQGRAGTYEFKISDKFDEGKKELIRADLASLDRFTLPHTPLSQKLFGESAQSGQDTTFLSWVAKRIPHINSYTKKSKGGSPIKTIAIYANKELKYDGEIYPKGDMLLSDYYFLNDDWVDRMSTLVHEAKHADGTHHVRCRTDRNSALDENYDWEKGACDRDETGAYSAEAMFVLQVAKTHGNLPPSWIFGNAIKSINRVKRENSRHLWLKEILLSFPELNSQAIQASIGVSP